MKQTSFNAQTGNILILLLIAIALLAGLSMMVMRSGVLDADAVAPEQAKITAAQVMERARNVEQAVKNLLANGCSEQTLNFENPIVAGYANGNAPADDSCDVFKPAGGGLLWPDIPAQASTSGNWLIIADNAVGGLTQTDDGTCSSAGCIDPMIMLPNVPEAVCQQINILAGVTTGLTAPPVDAGNVNAAQKWVAMDALDAASAGTPLLDAGNVLKGRPTGCFDPTNVDGVGAGAGVYYFYHVLVTR